MLNKYTKPQRKPKKHPSHTLQRNTHHIHSIFVTVNKDANAVVLLATRAGALSQTKKMSSFD